MSDDDGDGVLNDSDEDIDLGIAEPKSTEMESGGSKQEYTGIGKQTRVS